jgi:hypothetical protein
MRDFGADFLCAIFDILELSRQKSHAEKMCQKIHLTTTRSFERGLIRRVIAESMMSRWKQLFGASLKSNCYQRIKIEVQLKARMINTMMMGWPDLFN